LLLGNRPCKLLPLLTVPTPYEEYPAAAAAAAAALCAKQPPNSLIARSPRLAAECFQKRLVDDDDGPVETGEKTTPGGDGEGECWEPRSDGGKRGRRGAR